MRNDARPPIQPLKFLCVSMLFACFAAPASAHPVPKEQYDRKIKVKLVRTDQRTVQIYVDYRLEIDEATAIQDTLKNFSDQIDIGAATDKRQAFFAAYTKLFSPFLADNVTVKVNDKLVSLKVIKHGHDLKDEKGQPLGHLRCDFTLAATVDVDPSKGHHLSVQEDNFSFPSPKTGLIDLSLVTDDSVPLYEVQQPDEKLKQKPLTELGPGDEQLLRQVSAKFTLPKVEPELVSPSKQDTLDSTPEAKKPATTAPASSVKHDTELSDLFFSSSYSVPILLLLALFFGAVHALAPGHGKTLVAAYLVGEQGTVFHALVLGLVTTLTHTGAVILVAIALMFVPNDEVKSVLDQVQIFFGLLIVCLGVWLLLCRLSGRADHVHLGGGNHHHHQHGHDHHHHDHAHADHSHDEHGTIVSNAGANKPVGMWRLVVLGMQGGIIPCWDAVIMLCAAIAANLLWLALPLLVAFSFGLAGVLVAVGVAVVYSRRFAESHWGDSRLIKALPVLSACIVIGLGFYLCYVGVHG